jgi:hypothetical protein
MYEFEVPQERSEEDKIAEEGAAVQTNFIHENAVKLGSVVGVPVANPLYSQSMLVSRSTPTNCESVQSDRG